MVVIKRLPPPPFSTGLINELKVLGEVFHPDPESDAYAQLQLLGVAISPVTSGEFESGVLLIPAASGPIERLNQIAVRLLGEGGCPWDQAQTHQSLKKYLLEESYELFQAIDENDQDAMVEELGDVLLQPLMHAEMARIAGNFTLDDVCNAIVAKLVRRHPHVFGDVTVADEKEVLKNWDAIKKQEKGRASKSLLEGVPNSLPALHRAFEVSKRAARTGFEWESEADVWNKFSEERAEYLAARASNDREEMKSELGDLFFTLVNIARHAEVEPEEALQSMVNRFIKRFQLMETLAEGPLSELSPEGWDDLWNQSKAILRSQA